MSAFVQRLRILSISLGWTGGIGLAMLASAIVLGLTLMPAAQDEYDALNDEVRNLRKLGTTAASVRPATSQRTQLEEYLATLPKRGRLNAQLALLHELASSHGLTLRNGEYRSAAAKDARIGRLQISVRTEGGYIELRRFLRALPKVLPAVAVSRISMIRQRPTDATLETNIDFALFYLSAET